MINKMLEKKPRKKNSYDLKWKRLTFGRGGKKQESWRLTPKDRFIGRIIQVYLKQRGSCTISDLYKLKEIRTVIKEDHARQYAIQYLIQAFARYGVLKTYWNNGYSIIKRDEKGYARRLQGQT